MYYKAQTVFEPNDLMHYGVKGMKWGVRKKAYDILNKGLNKIKNGTSVVKDKINKTSTNAEDKYYKQYLKDGYSKKEAKQAAASKVRIKKMMVATGCAAMVIGAGCAMYRFKNANMDVTIKAGKEMQRITPNKGEGSFDGMYVSYKKRDKKQYRDLYGYQRGQAESIFGSGKVYNRYMSSSKDLKIAGHRTNEKLFKEMKKKGTLDTSYTNYKAFATEAFMMQSGRDKDASITFMKELQRRGYDGLVDVNDSSKRGQHYDCISPVILMQNSNIKTKRVEENTATLGKAIAINAKVNVRKRGRNLATAATAAGAYEGYNLYTDGSKQKQEEKRTRSRRRR